MAHLWKTLATKSWMLSSGSPARMSTCLQASARTEDTQHPNPVGLVENVSGTKAHLHCTWTALPSATMRWTRRILAHLWREGSPAPVCTTPTVS